jgi:Fic family protein
VNEFKSGSFQSQGDYQCFVPSLVNRPWKIDDPRIIEALSRADRQLGRLDMFSEYIPNVDLFVRMHVTKEATESSRIEDTRTEIEEAVLPKEEIQAERRDDWQEVHNYIQAMNQAVEELNTIPFSNRLLRNAHATLMQGVRGEHKTPGEFRTSQNWIGGSNPGNARFIPPPHDLLQELMGDLEKFAHNAGLHLPPLLKVAIMHYQFETIHPFLDGNGRIGRLMIPLYLVSIGILKQPVLYLSDYLERNRDEYYDRLTRVREQKEAHALGDWLLFFLDGLSETAQNGVTTFTEILKFKEQWESTIQKWKPQSVSGLALFQHLFKQPCIDAQAVAETASVSMPTAYKLIDRFTRENLLREITGAKRGRLFLFDPYIKLFQRH